MRNEKLQLPSIIMIICYTNFLVSKSLLKTKFYFNHNYGIAIQILMDY
jgi:hypothetical protein